MTGHFLLEILFDIGSQILKANATKLRKDATFSSPTESDSEAVEVPWVNDFFFFFALTVTQEEMLKDQCQNRASGRKANVNTQWILSTIVSQPPRDESLTRRMKKAMIAIN